MSIEEAFLQQFAKLFVRYRDALTLDTNDDRGRQLERLNEAAERDRMFAAGRLALLEMETNATWKTIPGTSRMAERCGTGFAKRWRTLQDETYGEESVCDLAKSRPELRGPVNNYRRTSSFKLGKSGSVAGLAYES